MKDVQDAGEASSPELEHQHFLFCGPILLSWDRIRIQPTEINANPCGSGSTTMACVCVYLDLPIEGKGGGDCNAR
jgi:hypothetical protein